MSYSIAIDPAKIEKILKARKLNNSNAARKCGASDQWLSQACRKKVMRTTMAMTFCTVFGVTLSDIMPDEQVTETSSSVLDGVAEDCSSLRRNVSGLTLKVCEVEKAIENLTRLAERLCQMWEVME